VFYSYAEADEDLRSELDKHLSQLRREGLITTWHRRQVIAGQDWTKALDRHLNIASVILLLISADFLASDYCYGIEMQRAMERYNAGEARVIPILLRPVDWQRAPFGMLQALPNNGMPITKWRNRDAAFTDVALSIRTALENVQRLAVSTPHTSFPRIWNIPYPRNPMFTGREEILTHLIDALKASQTAALSQAQAISGLGGIGKTQIAIEYAYRHHQDYQAVFWMLADTRESLVSGYITIAGLLNLPEKDEQDQTIVVNAVVRWFTTHAEWLLILDSADDLAVVREFVPSMFGGHILLTTRVQALGKLARRIEVDIMPPEIGVLFLLRRALLIASDASLEDAAATDIATAGEICEELGGLPLALDQAGAFIEEVQCGLLDYQQRYRTRRTRLLKRRGGIVVDHPDPVATTWSLSFEKVEQRSPIAADLLRLCAVLHPDAIPLELITKGAHHLGLTLASVAEDDIALDEAIATLGAYSLIRRNAEEKTLSVHRLVQAVLKDAMEKQTRRLWAERAVQAVNEMFPEVEFTSWPQCERHLSHALVCAELIEQEQINSPEAARLLYNAGCYLLERNRSSREAYPLLQRVLALIEQHLGPEHIHTASVVDKLARCFETQGKYTEAEPLYRRALFIREQQLGDDHPDTGDSFNNLAGLFYAQGKYAEAELLYKRALEVYELHLGDGHLRTARSLNNLALLYQIQGKYEQAEPLLVRVLAIKEQQLGADHPSTALSLNNLAGLYETQGKYAEAELLFRRVLVIDEKIYGSEHPDVATDLNNLAELYRVQGEYGEAESLHRQALGIRERQLGADHPNTAQTLNNLALLYSSQGKYEQAESLHIQVLSIRERQLGAVHPETAQSLNNLAQLYDNQGKYGQAEPLYMRALGIREQQLGANHPDTAQSLNDLAGLRKSQRKYGEAELLLVRALGIRERQLGADHPDTAQSLNDLALLYDDLGRYEQAEPLYRRALTIREQRLGTNHPDTAQTLNNLAGLYWNQGKYKEAEPLFQRALIIREQALGPEHPDTANSVTWLAFVYSQQQQYEKAEPLYRRACSILEQTLGSEHPTTKKIQEQYIALLRKMGRDEETTAIETNDDVPL
jgi:tetratricopeptide (TPR) repeat protein